MSKYNHYIKVKDKICISYHGHATEYIVQLRMLRKSLEQKLNLDITLACRPQYFSYLQSDPQSISSDNIGQKACEIGGTYGVVFPITYNANEEKHPILDLIEDCQLDIDKKTIKKSNNHYGIICPEGNFPNESLNAYQTIQLRSWIQSRGFKPMVIGTSFNETHLPIDKRPSIQERINLAQTAGFVIGVECDMIYEAMDNGIPTALVPTSKDSRKMYELLTTNPIILDC